MLKDRPRAKGKDPLFISYCRRGAGNRLRAVSIRKIIKSIFRDIGLPESLSAHSLRHAAGSIAIANDADLMDVQTMLGHRDISTTMIYVNSHNRLKSQSEKKIADAIFE